MASSNQTLQKIEDTQAAAIRIALDAWGKVQITIDPRAREQLPLTDITFNLYFLDGKYHVTKTYANDDHSGRNLHYTTPDRTIAINLMKDCLPKSVFKQKWADELLAKLSNGENQGVADFIEP
jgi:hypothetical protein